MNAESQSDARDPDGIERENEELRQDMGRTLQALERKLSPGQLMDQAMQMFKEHGGDMAIQLGATVKRNPVPAVLTAVGVAWMIASYGRGSSSRNVYDESDYTGYGTGTGYGEDLANADEESTTSGLKQRVAQAGERLNQAKSRLRSRVSQTTGHLGERASRARERLRGTKESVLNSAHSAAATGRHTRETVQTMFQEHPLVMGAVGVAIGALIGSVLPATEREDRLMGEARDRTVRRAREAGEQQLQRARDTATRAFEGAKQAVSSSEATTH